MCLMFKALQAFHFPIGLIKASLTQLPQALWLLDLHCFLFAFFFCLLFNALGKEKQNSTEGLT